MTTKRYLSDSSTIISGDFLTFVKKHIHNEEKIQILLSRSVISEIEHISNIKRKKEPRDSALLELKAIKDLEKQYPDTITINVVGTRPTREEIKLAKSGELDAMIRKQAKDNDAILVTSDRIQAELAEIEDVISYYIEQKIETRSIESFFTHSDIMSVHLSEHVRPRAKRGSPGQWYIDYLSNTPLKKEELKLINQDIVTRARREDTGYIELDHPACSVVQLENMRIVISRPPFSKQLEITAVRPIVKLELDDYEIDAGMRRRLEKAEGILVAGSPGAGKSTFSAALAERYAKKGKIVKTVERPRDLMVSSEITQYSPLDGEVSRTADIILLVRPDYVLYDEVRDFNDFKVYTDLRLAGCGVLGVVHSSTAIDAIQRFVGKIELGIVPQVVDTVIFIKGGEISEVLKLRMTVKVPHGMTQDDLARPVIIITDFETGIAEYELYVFGENTVLMPIQETSPEDTSLMEQVQIELTKRASYHTKIRQIGKGRVSGKPRFEVIIHPKDKPRILGKKGSNIHAIEQQYNCSIQIYENRNLQRLSKAMKRRVQAQTGTKSEKEYTNFLKKQETPDYWEESFNYLNPSAIKRVEDGLIIYFPGLKAGDKVTISTGDKKNLITKRLEEPGKIYFDKTSRAGVILLAALERDKILYYKTDEA